MIDKVIAGTNIAVPRKGLGCSQSAIAGKLNVSADFSCNSYCSPTPGQPSIGEKLWVWTLSAYYKKSRIEKGNSRELGERFCRNFILAIPKALKA